MAGLIEGMNQQDFVYAYSLGDAVRLYRFRHNISQEEMGSRLGVSENTIFLWEKGLSKPGIASMVRIAGLFDVPLPVVVAKSKMPNTEETAG